jgi:hypothetical protein
MMDMRELAVTTAIEAFRKDKLGKHLPVIAILADLYALWERGDLKRGLTDNDYRDWNHAAAAVPLCQYFFTEAHLATQLRQMGADKRYGCSIASTAAGALDALTA